MSLLVNGSTTAMMSWVVQPSHADEPELAHIIMSFDS